MRETAIEHGGRAADILDAAERMARIGGYNGFSFREIAKDVGIKAASVHYHFPGKEDLGAALARRYTDRFLDALGDPGDSGKNPEQLVERYVRIFRKALMEDGLMCLCGMLGAEIAYLPENIARETRRFFDLNIDWLQQVLARKEPKAGKVAHRDKAMALLAALEGAIILSRTIDDLAAFDRIAAEITRAI